MYRRCIYCSGELGRNEALEAFPVGKTVAFDASRGRLWAVCPGCGRWNLAPLEDRWEPVEAAERAFRGTRLRVQSENIGLAPLPDGTRLIRVGEALPGELAAWRYGDQLVRRHRRSVAATGTVAAGALAAFAGGVGAMGALVLLPVIPLAIYTPLMYEVARGHWQKRKPFFVAGSVTLRRWHLHAARLVADEAGEPALEVHNAGYHDPQVVDDPEPLVLGTAHARAALGRGSVFLNPSGASRPLVAGALAILEDAGSAEGYLRRTARLGHRLKPPLMSTHRWSGGPVLGAPQRLALEIALHEEQERRALEGEMTVLEAAWRDAEEIAGIADRLAIVGGGG